MTESCAFTVLSITRNLLKEMIASFELFLDYRCFCCCCCCFVAFTAEFSYPGIVFDDLFL